nr:hypothetical protein [Hymenobacter crusticola]
MPFASLGIASTMLVGIMLGHVATSAPLYRITVSPTNEGLGTAFFQFPLWLARASGHSPSGSGSAELALLYLVITAGLFFTGAGRYSLDQLFLQRKKATSPPFDQPASRLS